MVILFKNAKYQPFIKYQLNYLCSLKKKNLNKKKKKELFHLMWHKNDCCKNVKTFFKNIQKFIPPTPLHYFILNFFFF